MASILMFNSRCLKKSVEFVGRKHNGGTRYFCAESLPALSEFISAGRIGAFAFKVELRRRALLRYNISIYNICHQTSSESDDISDTYTCKEDDYLFVFVISYFLF